MDPNEVARTLAKLGKQEVCHYCKAKVHSQALHLFECPVAQPNDEQVETTKEVIADVIFAEIERQAEERKRTNPEGYWPIRIQYFQPQWMFGIEHPVRVEGIIDVDAIAQKILDALKAHND